MRVWWVALAALVLAGPAAAAGSKTLKDWTGVCDNLRACALFGFSSAQGGDIVYLKITRGGAGADRPAVSLSHMADGAAAKGPWSLALDGKPLAGFAALTPKTGETYNTAALGPAQSEALIKAIRNGVALQIRDGGKTVGEVSLAGSAAALLWLDEQQKRIGTVTALARGGPQPASAVPPVPPAPAVAAGPAAAQTGLPARMPAAVKAELKAVADCSDPLPDADGDGVIARLAPGVVLWGPVCDRAAYNSLTAFFIGDEKGGALKPVAFPLPEGSSEPTAQAIMNVDYAPATRTLTAFAKGRGLGDCGDETAWVWDGKAFQLLRQSVMPECRGVISTDWPPIYTAKRR